MTKQELQDLKEAIEESTETRQHILRRLDAGEDIDAVLLWELLDKADQKIANVLKKHRIKL